MFQRNPELPPPHRSPPRRASTSAGDCAPRHVAQPRLRCSSAPGPSAVARRSTAARRSHRIAGGGAPSRRGCEAHELGTDGGPRVVTLCVALRHVLAPPQRPPANPLRVDMVSRADRDACNSERVGAKAPPVRERQPSRREGRPKPLGDDLGGTLRLCHLLSEGAAPRPHLPAQRA